MEWRGVGRSDFLFNARVSIFSLEISRNSVFFFSRNFEKKNQKKFEKILDIPPPIDIIRHFFHQGGF